MDLKCFVGKDVCLTLYRHHKIKKYHGRLTVAGGRRLCLLIDNRSYWFSKPNWFKDSIELEL